MEDFGNSDTPETVEREFVLMPLFRRIGAAFSRNSDTNSSQAQALPPDTYVIYPDRLGNYEPERTPAVAQAVSEPQLPPLVAETAQPMPAETAVQAHVAAPIERPIIPVRLEGRAAAQSIEHPAVQSVPEPVIANREIAQPPSEPVPANQIEQPSQTERPIAAKSDAPVIAEPTVFRTESPRVRREEPIPFAAHDTPSEENLGAANLAYVMQKAKTPRRTSDARPPRFTKRQVTVTVPQPNWSAMRPNWTLLRPALTYGAVGFATCLLLFLVPGLRHPASSAFPPQTATAQHTRQPAASQGYTVQTAGVQAQGFTLNAQPAQAAPPPAPSPAAHKPKPHASIREAEPEVVVHHYTAPAKPRVMRASSGDVKKYSDLN